MKIIKNKKWEKENLNKNDVLIPQGWKVIRLEDEIVSFPPSKENASEGNKKGSYPFFNASAKQTLFSEKYLIDDESVIITTGGDYAFSLYYKGKFSFSSHVWCFKLKNHSNLFFNYLFKYRFDEIQNLAVKGFKLKNLNKKDFKNMQFVFPEIKEQQRIADVLSKQESIINKTKELINELDKRNTFMLDELLSGRLRIKDEDGAITFYKNPEDNWQNVVMNGEEKRIPKDFELSKIRKLCTWYSSGAALKAKEMKNEGKYPVVKMTDIKNGVIESGFKIYTDVFVEKSLLQKGDIVIGLSGSVGKLGIVKTETPLILNQRCLGMRIEKQRIITLKVLEINFKDFILSKIKAGVIPNISHNDVLDFVFSCPRDEREQESLSNLIKKIFDEKENHEQLLIEEQKKFDFLLEELMSGRLRIEE